VSSPQTTCAIFCVTLSLFDRLFAIFFLCMVY
jgi:hypothetical protein